jgi:carbon monoxide dehydrogenase subunit G
MRALLLILLFCVCSPAALAQPRPESEILIQTEKIGPLNVIDVSVSVPATPEQAWAVLTDWDNLASFMTNIKASRIIARSGNTVRVKQTVRAKVWPFSFDIELDREIELLPYERMQFRLLGGDFDKMEGTVRLAEDPTGTRIVSHVESIPRFWIPPLIGPLLIEQETREQFRQIIDEIARRAAAQTAAPGAVDRTQ